MIWVGIDPGISGAIAVFDDAVKDSRFVDTPTVQVKSGKSMKNFQDPYAIAAILRGIKDCGDVFAAIEKVNAMPSCGKGGERVPMGVTSAFNFGMGFGMWIGILAALGIPHQQVAPVTWKSRMMAGSGKEKDASRQVAMQLFPTSAKDLTRKKDHGRADALLMAAWARSCGNLSPRQSPIKPKDRSLFEG